MNIHYQVLFSLALIIAIAKNEGVRTPPPPFLNPTCEIGVTHCKEIEKLIRLRNLV